MDRRRVALVLRNKCSFVNKNTGRIRPVPPAEPSEHLGVEMLPAKLGLPESKPNNAAHLVGKRSQILPAGPHPEERFRRIWGPIFMLCQFWNNGGSVSRKFVGCRGPYLTG